jgi:hypothetical protein
LFCRIRKIPSEYQKESDQFFTDAVAESPAFGSFFFCDDESLKPTYWGYILHHYSDLYLPFIGLLSDCEFGEKIKVHKSSFLTCQKDSTLSSPNTVQDSKCSFDGRHFLKQLSVLLPEHWNSEYDARDVVVPTAQDMIETQNYIHSSLEEKENEVEQLHIERS